MFTAEKDGTCIGIPTAEQAIIMQQAGFTIYKTVQQEVSTQELQNAIDNNEISLGTRTTTDTIGTTKIDLKMATIINTEE